MTPRKRKIELRRLIESLGFVCLGITQNPRNSHFVCHVRDDAGNVFKAVASSSTNGADCRALNNFKADVRRQSNREKGLLDV